jgi:hypothetical protein
MTKTAKAATTQPAVYKVEILTANKAGLAAFVHDLKKARVGHAKSTFPGGRERGATMKSSSMGTIPLSYHSNDSNGPKAAIAGYIGSFNRDVNVNRVNEYRNAMWRGDWWFTPDPVVVTDEGDIINGQHRLLAAEEVASTVKAGEVERHAPSFVVVWGVDKRAAILMDEARRTATDRRDIAIRFARSA